VLNYDRQAKTYDETRGGEPRARAAAHAARSLLPASARTLLDVGCGTGLVTTYLDRTSLRVFGTDASPGMLSLAASRLGPGRVVLADSRALPFVGGSLDAVITIWLLHLVTGVDAVIAEAARVLRPGGTLITTVDKDASHDVCSDLDDLLRPHRNDRPSDAFETVRGYGEARGLTHAGETTFAGHGQGRSPEAAAKLVRDGYFASAIALARTERDALAAALEALPDPTTRRPDPAYRLVAFRKS
jgi:SAM-dependent methyltransferase